ncbi:MAG TPA: YhfC family glutamic-type intramembrane protease, partial [Clostridia bacterium]|nr:YhfC family glutamic-type intramembrane protease [Clostridia bacterium]
GIKPILVGAAAFFVFALFLEQLLHSLVLHQVPAITSDPLLYAAYGGIAAGVFEETGRLVGFRFLLNKNSQWEQGVAYGLGHGGLELVCIGGLLAITEGQSFYYSIQINDGSFSQVIANAKDVPLQQSNLRMIQQQLTSAPSWEFLMGGLERVFALVIQIALSLVVLYAVSKGKYIFYALAVLLHATVDFTAAYLNRIQVPTPVIEGIVAVFAGIALFAIFRMKPLFTGGGELQHKLPKEVKRAD